MGALTAGQRVRSCCRSRGPSLQRVHLASRGLCGGGVSPLLGSSGEASPRPPGSSADEAQSHAWRAVAPRTSRRLGTTSPFPLPQPPPSEAEMPMARLPRNEPPAQGPLSLQSLECLGGRRWRPRRAVAALVFPTKVEVLWFCWFWCRTRPGQGHVCRVPCP